MGKSKGSAPQAPDPDKTARAESQFNRLDVFSPSGSGVVHGYSDPATGQFVRGTVPEGTNAQAAQQSIESDSERQIRELLEPASVSLTGKIIDDNIANLPDAPRVRDRGDVASDIFNRSLSVIAPGIDRTNKRLLNNLQSRGIPIGGEAFNEAYGEQLRETQDTLSRLAIDADIAAGQEQSRLFGLDQASRGNAISELVAALGGGYIPATNVPSGSAAPINYSGLVSQRYQSDLNAYNARNQNAANTAGAVGSLGAALIKSTMEAKTVEGYVDSNWAANAVKAMPISAWRYLEAHAPGGDQSRHIGPMAEHFQKLTGLGDGKTISMIDFMGLLASALQNALFKIETLEYEMNGGRIH